MKLAGFLTGAAVAGVGVFAYSALTTVTDTDLLTGVLADHCLPYVETGAIPFNEMGRTPGVFDDVDVNDQLTDGGVRLLYDNRFVAQWGVDMSGPIAVRVCQVASTFGIAGDFGFSIPDVDLIDAVTAVIAPDGRILPDLETLSNGPRTVGWFEPDVIEAEGLRVILVAGGGVVSSALAVDDLP